MSLTQLLGESFFMPDPLPSNHLVQIASSRVQRIAILGAESTGKTTLCQDLTHHFKQTLQRPAQWVVEYMRPYAQAKHDRGEGVLDWDDLLPIAIGQMQAENDAVRQVASQLNETGVGYVFCDTCLFEIMVYAHLYFDACPAIIEQAVHASTYEHILLTAMDIPWHPDVLRESPKGRQTIDACFVEALALHELEYVRVKGTRQHRVAQVSDLLLGSSNF